MYLLCIILHTPQSSLMAEPPLSPTNTPCIDHLYRFNTAVIVAAVICAFLCALGLNSMLRCIYECTLRALSEPVEWVAARAINTGLKKKEMVALPTLNYVDSSSPKLSSVSGCPICLVDFCDGDEMRVLPHCEHRFHVVCVDEWLISHSSCPSCRHQLKSDKCVCVPCLQIVSTL